MADGGVLEPSRPLVEQLARWHEPRYCHPREEHLLPLMVVAGAAAGDQGRKVFSDRWGPTSPRFSSGRSATAGK